MAQTSKKLYQEIADDINNISQYVAQQERRGWDVAGDEIIKKIVDNLCVTFKIDNPNFDKEKFIQACGIRG